MTKEEMFNKNIKIAYKIANRYLTNYASEYEDIKQIALMGLWKAVSTFNNTHAFSTYAYTVISNEINYYLRTVKKHYNTISLKREVKDLIKNETINISGFECIAVEDIRKLLEDKQYVCYL